MKYWLNLNGPSWYCHKTDNKLKKKEKEKIHKILGVFTGANKLKMKKNGIEDWISAHIVKVAF